MEQLIKRLALGLAAAAAATSSFLVYAAQDDALAREGFQVGSTREERAWEGYKIFKRADGSCYRVTHSNLLVENDPHGQHVHVEELMADEQCPQALVLSPQPSAH